MAAPATRWRRQRDYLAAAGDRPVDLYLVVGADLVPELGSWHHAGDLQRLVTLAVVSRPTGANAEVPPGCNLGGGRFAPQRMLAAQPAMAAPGHTAGTARPGR